MSDIRTRIKASIAMDFTGREWEGVPVQTLMEIGAHMALVELERKCLEDDHVNHRAVVVVQQEIDAIADGIPLRYRVM